MKFWNSSEFSLFIQEILAEKKFKKMGNFKTQERLQVKAKQRGHIRTLFNLIWKIVVRTLYRSCNQHWKIINLNLLINQKIWWSWNTPISISMVTNTQLDVRTRQKESGFNSKETRQSVRHQINSRYESHRMIMDSRTVSLDWSSPVRAMDLWSGALFGPEVAPTRSSNPTRFYFKSMSKRDGSDIQRLWNWMIKS